MAIAAGDQVVEPSGIDRIETSKRPTTIFVPAAGSETDEAVFSIALAAARALDAHLEFLHVCLSPSEAARFVPHIDFAQGGALRAAMNKLKVDQDVRLSRARQRFKKLCETQTIAVRDTPGGGAGVSAIWEEALGDPVERMLRHARYCDLTVLGRPSRVDGLPRELIELVLVGSGRPLLLAPPRSFESITGTAVVCWKETAEAARALAAALPLLARSRRVIALTVEERNGLSRDDAAAIVRYLAWHGVPAEAQWLSTDKRSAGEQIEAFASDHNADLVVMGGYGHGRTRELVFGGCTQHFLERADRPIFLMH
jgi:nucleotide-binding universal stress UspA family protein